MNADEIEVRLLRVVEELARQSEVGKVFPHGIMSLDEHIAQLREYLHVGECGIAYECMVALLGSFPFQLIDPASTNLNQAA